MRKLFLVLVAIFLATSAYAFSESETGPQNITVCYVTGMGNMTSGDVVILQTSSPTYWGREVTGTTTADLQIHGVVLDDKTDPGIDNTGFSGWVRVQTYGYCPIVKLASGAVATAGNSRLVTSTTQGCAKVTGDNTGNTIALETLTGASTNTSTIKAFIR